MQCCRMCCLHICSSWGVYDEGKKGWKRVGFLEEGVVNIDGGAGKHEEDALIVEEDDELGIQPFLVLQTHDFVLQHLGVSEKRRENAEHDEPVLSLFDEDVLFKHFKELHLVCAVEKEVGAVDHLSGGQLNRYDRHNKDVASSKFVHLVGDEQNSVSTVDQESDADPTLISLICGSWSV